MSTAVYESPQEARLVRAFLFLAVYLYPILPLCVGPHAYFKNTWRKLGRRPSSMKASHQKRRFANCLFFAGTRPRSRTHSFYLTPTAPVFSSNWRRSQLTKKTIKATHRQLLLTTLRSCHLQC
ncbi:hypothetical protein D7M10_04170 [Pseudomonas fluorescens]|nr:hypothetical protein D7M10_04170 [Pseudomonas fluorescens]